MNNISNDKVFILRENDEVDYLDSDGESIFEYYYTPITDDYGKYISIPFFEKYKNISLYSLYDYQ